MRATLPMTINNTELNVFFRGKAFDNTIEIYEVIAFLGKERVFRFDGEYQFGLLAGSIIADEIFLEVEKSIYEQVQSNH